MFFLVGAFFIISENNLKLSDSGNFSKFAGLYSLWLSHIFDNSRNLAGYVIKMSWLPNESSSAG